MKTRVIVEQAEGDGGPIPNTVWYTVEYFCELQHRWRFWERCYGNEKRAHKVAKSVAANLAGSPLIVAEYG